MNLFFVFLNAVLQNQIGPTLKIFFGSEIVTLILESGHWLVRKIVINKFMKIQDMIWVCRRTCFYVFDSIRIRFQASKTIRLVPVKIILIQICNI